MREKALGSGIVTAMFKTSRQSGNEVAYLYKTREGRRHALILSVEEIEELHMMAQGAHGESEDDNGREESPRLVRG